MADPFDEAPHQSPRSEAPLGKGTRESDPHHQNITYATSPAAHGRTASSNGNLAVPVYHQRRRSGDLDDHMDGSAWAGADICPSCNSPRGFSVYCMVSKLHHGTDEPLVETPKKKLGFLDRIRGKGSDDDDDSDDGAAQGGAEPGQAYNTDAQSPTKADEGKKAGWHFFKTKEEKELVEVDKESDRVYEYSVNAAQKSEWSTMRNEYKLFNASTAVTCKKFAKACEALDADAEKAYKQEYKEAKAGLGAMAKEGMATVSLIKKADKKRAADAKKSDAAAPEGAAADGGAEEAAEGAAESPAAASDAGAAPAAEEEDAAALAQAELVIRAETRVHHASPGAAAADDAADVESGDAIAEE
jgi:hypothetical protein